MIVTAVPGVPRSGEGLVSLNRGYSNTYEFIGSVVSATPLMTTTVYLPLVMRAGKDPFSKNPSIWVHASTPDSHEVALFRHTFALGEALHNSELHIFADTRYEVWVDGQWKGRGPARFSRVTREYDVYPLGELSADSHLVAVLVQWAPNYRRSESVTPLLMAHIQGFTEHGFTVVARTGSVWKASLSDAWSRDAVPVHSWGLIGPTEVLDLRRLPPDWMLPAFSDDDWLFAVVKTLSDTGYADQLRQFVSPYEQNGPGFSDQAWQGVSLVMTPQEMTYRPRTIEFLEDVSVLIVVTDAGLLSPGRTMVEVVPPVSTPHEFVFEATGPTVCTIEMLSESGTSPPANVRLDGREPFWAESGAARPDVWMASMSIASGDHVLSFAEIPAQGLTFSLSTRDILLDSSPFHQGVHAGRRLLLAEPVNQPEQVVVSSEDGLDIEFASPSTYAVLDLGRVVHGRLLAQAAGPSGAVLDIGWTQRLWQGSRPLPYPGSLHQQWNQTDSWVLDGTTRLVSTLDARAGRYILIAVWGSGPVQLENVEVFEERYPVTLRGKFSSSDTRLDQMWQVGVDTLYPNMTDAYTDTPWRERGQWWGDAYVEDHINRVAFGDTDLMKRGLSFMAEAFTDGRPNALAPNGDGAHMLDFGMLWVQSLHDYWCLKEDAQLPATVYPVLTEFISYLAGYESPTTGLLDIPSGHWSQTALIDWAGYSSRHGQSTAINALYYDTLMDAADIAVSVGDVLSATRWRAQAEFVREQVNAVLYIPSQGRYWSGILGGQAVPPSPHAQAWALAYGLVPEYESGRVASSLLELLSSDPSSPNVEIYGMFWVLEALGRVGRISEAMTVVERYYGRLLDQGATTWWEVFDAGSLYHQSLAHGWGGAPTWFLTAYVLGARRVGPASWTVKPAFWSVSAASGTLPFGDSELQVSWQAWTCDDRTLELTSPAGTEGQVIIPFIGDTTVVTLNGNVIWQDGMPLAENVVKLSDGLHISSLEGGTYHFDAHQDCVALHLPLVFR